MSGSDSYHILLIHPPVASPTMYPWVLAYTVSCITSWGTSLHYYDANLDFFLHHILTSKTLTGFLELVKKREKQGVFKGYPISMSKLAKDISINHELWNRKISTIGFNLESLRTGEFYKPEKYISAITDINDLLMLVSLAFYPSCIHWSGFSNPDVKELRHIDTFVDDRDTNPFFRALRKWPDKQNCLQSIKTLSNTCSITGPGTGCTHFGTSQQKLRPDLDTVIMGNHELFGASGYVGNFFKRKI